MNNQVPLDDQTQEDANVAFKLLQVREQFLESPPSVNFDETVPCQQGFLLNIPESSGIYFFHDLRGVLYIGQSNNLRRRFDEHFWNKENPQLAKAVAHPSGEVYFSFIKVDILELDLVERSYIRSFYPLCNRIQYSRSN